MYSPQRGKIGKVCLMAGSIPLNAALEHVTMASVATGKVHPLDGTDSYPKTTLPPEQAHSGGEEQEEAE
jgi:hypothetical protein